MEVTQEQWNQLNQLSLSLSRLSESYTLSYLAFIEFFAEKNELRIQDIIIGANFSYGWMPTILDIYSNDLVEQVNILNRLKQEDKIPSKDEFELLKTTFNNSIVGTSKLMHFISPKLIPIWDSRVHNCVREFIKISYQPNNVNNFIDYVSFCQSIINDSRFVVLKKRVGEFCNESITDMRAIEQLFFLAKRNN